MVRVIYHRADYDGLFSAAVCKHFMPDAKLIGWDFGDIAVSWDSSPDDVVYVVDLPPTAVTNPFSRNMVWIDHHKSSIDLYDPSDAEMSYQGMKRIPGYRIDGVAACRLCWAWFLEQSSGKSPEAFTLPTKAEFTHRSVSEPLALTLAGEYDVWDLRDPRALQFQFGLTMFSDDPETLDMHLLRGISDPSVRLALTEHLCEQGETALRWQFEFASDVQRERSYVRELEGVRFCVLGSAHARNSMWFPLGGMEEAEALMCWRYDGKQVTFSLYHAPGHTDLDLSKIAVKYGGGGHRGACGFSLPLEKALEIIQ